MSYAATRNNPNPQSQPQDGAPTEGITAIPADADRPVAPSGKRPDPDKLLPRVVGWYKSSRDHWQEQRQEMAEAFDLRAGHQWSDEDLQILSDQMRPAITINMVDKFVDAVGGFEINNRVETTYIPRQVGATGVNDLLTSAAQWVRQECDAEDEETESFLDMVTCGWGWCLSGDAMVRLPNSHMMMTRLYTGAVVDISMENGQSLTGTANHPVLTTAGWKGLHELKEGDYLVNGSFLEAVVGFPCDQFDDVETRLQDKIDAFRVGREVIRVPTAPDDFHSDGRGSDVHVVYADRFLKRKMLQAARFKKIEQELLAWNDLLAGRCLEFFGLCLFSGAVSVAEHKAPLSAAHAPHLHSLGNLLFSQFEASFAKPLSDGFVTNAYQLAYFYGCQLLVEIEACQLAYRCFWDRVRASVVGPQDVASVDQAHFDGTIGHTYLCRDFSDWKPLLEVEARQLGSGDGVLSQHVTRVVGRIVRAVKDFAVHDVATSVGLFIAGGVVTSNTQTRMEFSGEDDEPDGMPVIERIDPMEMFPDSNARKQNLADRRYQCRVKDVPIGAAEELFPDRDPIDLHAQWAEDQPDATRSPHNARLAPYYRIDQSADVDRTEQLCRLVEVEWWDWETVYRVLDPETGRWVMLDEERAMLYEIMARQSGIKPQRIKDRRRKYWKAIVGAEVLKIMDGPKKGGFQYKCMTGKRDRNKGTWYGIVRAMRDPQLWANKWVSQGLHIFNTNAKGGLLAETDAFADIDEARDSWAEADSIVELNPGGLTKIQPKQPAAFPPQLNQMTEFAMNAFPQVTGINMELLGQSQTQSPQVALLEAGRRSQGMNILAGLFNAKRRYHKEQGRLLLWMIQEFIADGRLIRIGGPEQRQYVPLIREPGLAEYDVIVDDAPTSTNMKEKVWGALMQLFPMLRGMNLPPQFYMWALKWSPVPAGAVQEATQILEQPPPPNAAQQSAEALNQAKAQEIQAKIGVHAAEAQHTTAETARVLTETQMQPDEHGLKVTAQQATIEKTRADAAMALAKAGLDRDDMRFQQTMAAVDALLRVHGAALDHAAALAPPEPPTPTATPG